MSPWALQGAGITQGEHHCLMLHLLSLSRHSTGDVASSPPRELISYPSTQLLLPSSTQVLVAATRDCQDVCVSGGPLTCRNYHSYFLHIFFFFFFFVFSQVSTPDHDGKPPTRLDTNQLETGVCFLWCMVHVLITSEFSILSWFF